VTTENLAILFTDIVGSTQLSHRQSPEDADEVRRGHFSILRQAVTEAGGKEVKNLGDGLMAVFGSASTALACAVAMSADRALVLATLCSELAHGSPLERRQALADEAVAIAESLGDDAVIVRVLNHIQIALQVPSLLRQSLIRTTNALRLAERVGDPVQLFWAAQWRAEAAAREGDMDEMLRCIGIHGSMADQLNQPIFNWGHAFVSAVPAQIAGDTDRAEALANEALRIGKESGQPDAETIFGAQFIIVCGQRGP